MWRGHTLGRKRHMLKNTLCNTDVYIRRKKYVKIVTMVIFVEIFISFLSVPKIFNEEEWGYYFHNQTKTNSFINQKNSKFDCK